MSYQRIPSDLHSTPLNPESSEQRLPPYPPTCPPLFPPQPSPPPPSYVYPPLSESQVPLLNPFSRPNTDTVPPPSVYPPPSGYPPPPVYPPPPPPLHGCLFNSCCPSNAPVPQPPPCYPHLQRQRENCCLKFLSECLAALCCCCVLNECCSCCF